MLISFGRWCERFRLLALLLLLLGLPASVSFGQILSFQGHQYGLTSSNLSWVEAEAEAVALGGHLVTINSSEENDFLATTFFQEFGVRDYWIGYYSPEGPDSDKSSYEWSSGQPVTFVNWRSHQPDSWRDSRYVVIGYRGDGTWDNYPNSAYRTVPGIYEIGCLLMPQDGDLNKDGSVDLDPLCQNG
ncbi:MAG: hypothetical protein JEZ07_18020 [Phycisphaerae bacterium]|nr:hypothetical protein [Phycisphaerae bacterium]